MNIVRKDNKTFTEDKAQDLELLNLSETDFVGRKSAYVAGLDLKTERDRGATKVTKAKVNLKAHLPPKKANNRNSQLNLTSASKIKNATLEPSISGNYSNTKFIISPSKLKLLKNGSHSLLPNGILPNNTEPDHAYISTEMDPMLPHRFGKQTQQTPLNFHALPEETEINSIDYQSTGQNLLFRPDFSG